MSSNHQLVWAQPESTMPFNAERMVKFIDRFTAMIVEKLQRLEDQESSASAQE